MVVQDTSARNALQTFTGGKGDVLLDYENDAIFAQQNGEAVDYVIPSQTILIQNPAAVTVKASNPALAKAFLDFVYTPTAQKIFADNGYRPVVPGRGPGRQVPDAGVAVHHRRPRRLDGGDQAVLRPHHRHRRQDRAVQRGVDIQLSAPRAGAER